MSQETRVLRRFLLIVRRPWAAIGSAAVLGLLAGAGYVALTPPLLASSAALVVLPSSIHDTAAQVAIARSNVVLGRATRSAAPAMSLQTVRSRVRVKSVTPTILSVTAQGKTAAQAEGTANAVASSYIAEVSHHGEVPVQARLLQSAMNATRTPLSHRLPITGGLGALIGGLIGAAGVLALRRSDPRLHS